MTEQHTPKVSVIIPVYNVEPYLRECLNSIVQQTINDIEIICVDDGSTDGCPAILEEYQHKDSRITVITQENRGQAAARNRGMDLARGEYIYFIDSDDYVERTLLERASAIADEHMLDALVFGMDQFLESNEIDSKSLYRIRPLENIQEPISGVEYIKRTNANKTYPGIVVVELWRREFFNDNAIRFKEGIIYEDSLFAFEAFMAAKRVAQINDIFYHYRRWGNSTTLKPITPENVKSCFACTQEVLSYAFRENNTPEENYVIGRLYARYAKITNRYYQTLSAKEKAMVAFPDEMQNILFRQIILNYSITDKGYRLERAITWPLRIIKAAARTLRRH